MRSRAVFGSGAKALEIELSQADREKWDARYLRGAYATRPHPSALLTQWVNRLEAASAPAAAAATGAAHGAAPGATGAAPGATGAAPGATGAAPTVIDIACGRGRNSLFLARRGWHVDAIDISPAALERLRAAAAADKLLVKCTERDLEPASGALEGFRDRRYNLALMIRYTDIRLVEALPRVLAAGGHLVAEMHLQTDEPVAGPRSPRFRAAPGALFKAAAGLELLHYDEGLVTDPDGRTVALARLVGRRRESPFT